MWKIFFKSAKAPLNYEDVKDLFQRGITIM